MTVVFAEGNQPEDFVGRGRRPVGANTQKVMPGSQRGLEAILVASKTLIRARRDVLDSGVGPIDPDMKKEAARYFDTLLRLVVEPDLPVPKHILNILADLEDIAHHNTFTSQLVGLDELLQRRATELRDTVGI